MSRAPVTEWPPHTPPEVPPPHRTPSPWSPQPPSPPPVLPGWDELHTSPRDDELADRLLEQRVIYLGGHLDAELGNRGAMRLLLLARRDDSPIELHLACSGSDLGASLALADTVEIVTAPVHVTVHGTISGPAVAVLCAAGERTALRTATIVLTVARASADGTAGELAVQARQHERQLSHLHDLVARATGHTPDEVADDFATGRVLSAEEALEYRLLQRVE